MYKRRVEGQTGLTNEWDAEVQDAGKGKCKRKSKDLMNDASAKLQDDGQGKGKGKGKDLMNDATAELQDAGKGQDLALIHIAEPTRPY